MVQLIASSFLGGPERQMLGLAQEMAPRWRTIFVSFAEGGTGREFLERASQLGFEAISLRHDTPHFPAAISEIRRLLARVGAGVLCCHGYKPDLLGALAARREGVPVVAVSRGWTAETWRVRGYERLDRLALRWMDRVVCVSGEQARKVRRAGVPPHKIEVIYNSVCGSRFARTEAQPRRRLESLFSRPVRWIVGSAGRLSPEKGTDVLVEAAAAVVSERSDVGFIHFGEGRLRKSLERRIARRGLAERFLLPGHCDHLDQLMPHFDLFALSSHTEGLPNVVLEAQAAGVPVVATRAGGTPELVEDGKTGRLVPAGDDAALARVLLDVLASPAQGRILSEAAQQLVARQFTFQAQAERYERLFASLRSC
jgi:glycosyltransferase involved in cell wall biosynthesis